jgi:hypothetical protein
MKIFKIILLHNYFLVISTLAQGHIWDVKFDSNDYVNTYTTNSSVNNGEILDSLTALITYEKLSNKNNPPVQYNIAITKDGG